MVSSLENLGQKHFASFFQLSEIYIKFAQNKDNTKSVNDVKMDDVNGMDMNITLKQFSDRIEDLGKEAPDFILARNDIILEK